ncbi:hypothetical protein UlMin_027326 [Ulmus minor]
MERTVRLKVQEEEDWEIPEEDPAEATEFALVGRLMTGKPWNKKLMSTILGRLWGADSGWALKILEQKGCNCYIALSFKDKELFYWVIEKRPWTLNGGVLLVDYWPVSGDWEKASLNYYSCWGKAYGIPLKLLTENNVRRIVSSAGETLDVHLDSAKTTFWRNFIRFKVGINVDKAICPGRFVPGDVNAKWVQFKYDKLPFMCFKCGLIGHEKASCEQPLLTVADAVGVEVPALGPWLRVEHTTKDCFEAARLLREGPAKKP